MSVNATQKNVSRLADHHMTFLKKNSVVWKETNTICLKDILVIIALFPDIIHSIFILGDIYCIIWNQNAQSSMQ